MQGIESLFRSVRLPGERALQRWAIHPNSVTICSLACGLAAALAFGAGAVGLGGALYLASGLLDAYDGRLARSSGRASRAGAMLDSVADRYVELAVLIAINLRAFDLAGRAAALLALSGSILVSYTRARGEALGAHMAGVGLLRRPERILLVGLAGVGAAIWGPAVLTVMLGMVGILAHASALARLRSAYSSLADEVSQPCARSRARSRRSGCAPGH